MKSEIIIEPKGPFKLFGEGSDMLFGSNLAMDKGLYLWTAPYKGQFLISYIGITSRSFYERLAEHLKSFFVGEYRIDDLNPKLKNGKKMIYSGIYGIPLKDRLKVRNDFFTHQDKYNAKLQENFKQERIFLCLLKENKRVFERIEAAFYNHLYAQPDPVGRYMEKGIRYRPRYSTEKPVRIKIINNVKILGLPKELEI